MEEVCTVSEQTGEETLRLPDYRCAPKFSLQPAFIYAQLVRKPLSVTERIMVLLLFISFSYSIWLFSHFQLLNSTYISRPLSMCLSSQVKSQSHSRKVEVIEPNGVWRTPACQELNIISKQSRRASSQRQPRFSLPSDSGQTHLATYPARLISFVLFDCFILFSLANLLL